MRGDDSRRGAASTEASSAGWAAVRDPIQPAVVVGADPKLTDLLARDADLPRVQSGQERSQSR